MSNSTSSGSGKAVNFGDVEIREYARCLGDNPATTHGPPLAIDWRYSIVGTYELEDYEASRPPRRATNQMLVPGFVREQILLEQTDATKRQINEKINALKVARHQRQMCVAMQKFEDHHLIFESIGRKFRRFKTGVSKKKEQELLWEDAKRFHQQQINKTNGGGSRHGDERSEDTLDSTCSAPVKSPIKSVLVVHSTVN